MNRLNPDGGSCAPSLGRMPRGANQQAMKPASRSMLSDWYDEKSWSAATQERKSTVQAIVVRRGQTFAVRRRDAMMPAATTIVSAQSPAPSQKSVGAYQRPSTMPSTRWTLPRYSPAGRIPRWPMRPWIWNASE